MNFLINAGLLNIQFHYLCHIATSLMVKQGVSVKVVQQRLDHSDAAVALSISSHIIPSMDQETGQ